MVATFPNPTEHKQAWILYEAAEGLCSRRGATWLLSHGSDGTRASAIADSWCGAGSALHVALHTPLACLDISSSRLLGHD